MERKGRKMKDGQERNKLEDREKKSKWYTSEKEVN